MEIVIWIGIALTLVGLGLLIYCIKSAFSAKKLGGSDDEIRDRLQKLVPINLLALMSSAIGLGAVMVGLFLS